MAHHDPDQDRDDRTLETPGDTGAADIVGPTGEQMPRKSHDGVDDESKRSTRVNDEERVTPSRDGSAGSQGQHGNPRTGRISDW